MFKISKNRLSFTNNHKLSIFFKLCLITKRNFIKKYIKIYIKKCIYY